MENKKLILKKDLIYLTLTLQMLSGGLEQIRRIY